MESSPRVENGLAGSQKRTLELMLRSHRLLVAYIYYNISIMYIWVGWVVFFILWIDLPLPLLSIAFVVIAIPILIAPMQYRTAKRRYSHLLSAKQILLDMQISINASQITSGIVRYCTVLFSVVSPNKETVDSGSVGRDKISVRNLRIDSAGTLAFQAFLVYLIFQNFFIPEVVILLETGGIMAVIFNPVMMLMAIILAMMFVGFFIFLFWEVQVRQWIRVYHGFLEWGEEIEKMVFSEFEEGDTSK